MEEEAVFIVEFNTENGLTYVAPQNKEAIEVYEEVSKEIPSQPFIKFILLSPNSLDVNKHGKFIYEVDLNYKNRVIEELKSMGS